MTGALLLAMPKYLLNRLIQLIGAGLAKYDEPGPERAGYVMALTLVMWLAVNQTSISAVSTAKTIIRAALWILNFCHIPVPSEWLAVLGLGLIVWMFAHAPRYYREMMVRFRSLP